MEREYNVGTWLTPSDEYIKDIKDALVEKGIVEELTNGEDIPENLKEELEKVIPENIKSGVQIGNVKGVLNLSLDDIDLEDIKASAISTRNLLDTNTSQNFSYSIVSPDKHSVYGSYNSSKTGLYKIDIFTGEETKILDHENAYSYQSMAIDRFGWTYFCKANVNDVYTFVRVKDNKVEDHSNLKITTNSKPFQFRDASGNLLVYSSTNRKTYKFTNEGVEEIFNDYPRAGIVTNDFVLISFFNTHGLYRFHNGLLIQLYDKGTYWSTYKEYNGYLYVSTASPTSNNNNIITNGIFKLKDEEFTIISTDEFVSSFGANSSIGVYTATVKDKPFYINENDEIVYIGDSIIGHGRTLNDLLLAVDNGKIYYAYKDAMNELPLLWVYDIPSKTFTSIDVSSLGYEISYISTLSQTEKYLYTRFRNKETSAYKNYRIDKETYTINDIGTGNPYYGIASLSNGLELVYQSTNYSYYYAYAISPTGTKSSYLSQIYNLDKTKYFNIKHNNEDLDFLFTSDDLRFVVYDSSTDKITYTSIYDALDSYGNMSFVEPIVIKDYAIFINGEASSVVNIFDLSKKKKLTFNTSPSLGFRANNYVKVSESVYILYETKQTRNVAILVIDENSILKVFKASF